MSDYSIIDHIVLYSLHGTSDLIYKNFSISKVVIYFF